MTNLRRTWNYRLIRFPAQPGKMFAEPWIALHEVYYGRTGDIVAWSEEPVRFMCDEDEGPEGITKSLQRALEASQKPILDATTLPGWTGGDGQPGAVPP